MSLNLAQQAKTAQVLKLLAFKCGLVQGARKADTTQVLQDAAAQHVALPQTARILSIDMGIRNFAFSLLSPPSTTDRGTHGRQPRATVHAWNNLSLHLGTKSAGQDTDGAMVKPVSITPVAMAQVASDLVRQHLLPLKPTHVLIERQRSRSGGSATVIEWTLRINMLEAMLYALFTDLRACGSWHGELVPVLPNQVLSFAAKEFLQEHAQPQTQLPVETPEQPSHGAVLLALADALGKRGQASYKETKKHKVAMVGVMLDRGCELAFKGEEMSSLKHEFVQQWLSTTAKGRSRKKAGTPDRLKLDDLADSLLQGLTWMKWMSNRQVLASGSLASLLEPYAVDNEQDKISKGCR